MNPEEYSKFKVGDKVNVLPNKFPYPNPLTPHLEYTISSVRQGTPHGIYYYVQEKPERHCFYWEEHLRISLKVEREMKLKKIFEKS